MATPSRFRARYGAGGWHLLLMLSSGVLALYVVAVLGFDSLWDSDVWWQSILVWFVGAVAIHDLVLFPAYAAADRLLMAALARRRHRAAPSAVPLVNHVRVPVLACGLLFLLFWPGIVGQGGPTHLAATGQAQQGYLGRYLLLSAAVVLTSALVYVVRLLRSR